MEQVRFALDEAYNAEMRHIEPLGFCGKTDDVAVAQLADNVFLIEVALVDYRKSVAVVARLKVFNFSIGSAVGQRGITAAVGRHEIERLHDSLAARKLAGDFAEIAAVGVFNHPSADVVEARCVSVDAPGMVADVFELRCVGVPRRRLRYGSFGQGNECFHECGAVKLVHVDGEILAVALKSVRYIGRAHEFVGEKRHVLALRLERLVGNRIVEHLVDFHSVVGTVETQRLD